jgi:N-acetylmuramoyl-L-alanine amidase
VEAGDPLFTWNGEVFQLVGTPYLQGGELWIPAQLVVDFFPDRLREHYRARSSPREGVPVVERLSAWSGAAEAGPAAGAASDTPTPASGEEPGARRGGRVVVIDPGHGGRDPGALGPGGTREKDVALALGLALARELERHPGLEVHLTRESDILVPLWNRGEWATEVKGDRPGIFVSLHANAVPSRSGVRGFETYFLDEARTEHEARVAANENAPLALEREDAAGAADLPELEFILRDLRNNDHAHWSEELAAMVQDRLSPVHPGPDRGVKQGPLAVITNALMPSVLVEVGFLSHPDEERLLTRPEFHAEVAGALSAAVVDFFRRYPPGREVDVTAAAEVEAAGARDR